MTGEWSVFILVLKPRPHGPFHGIMFKSNDRKIYAWRIIMGKIFKHKLTTRQKEILERTKLPNNWEELSTYHRRIIKRIEKMIKYLEKKYGKKFYYKGYVPGNKLFLDEEYMVAYAEGDDPETGCFSVEPKGLGFSDGYAWVTQAPIVQKEMEEKLAGIFEGQKYKMFVELTGVSDEGEVKCFHIYIYLENTDLSVTEQLMDKVILAITGDSRVHSIDMYCFGESIVDKITAKEHNRCFDLEDIVIHYMSHEKDREKGIGWTKR